MSEEGTTNETGEGMTATRSSPAENPGRCKWEEDGERCERPRQAHGLCRAHYARARYSKDLEYLLPEAGRAERCWVKNCERPAYSRDLCRAHYAYVRHHDIGTIDAINSRRTARAIAKKDAVTINGQRLSALKVVSGSELKDIGGAAGRSRQWAHKVMSGRIGSTERNAAQAVADHFGVPLAWLIDPAPLTLADLGVPSGTPPGQSA